VQFEALGSVYLRETGLLVPPAEWKVIAFLPSVGNLSFFLFGKVERVRSPSIRDSGEGSLWHQKIAKLGT
jgi:hypothetical protein